MNNDNVLQNILQCNIAGGIAVNSSAGCGKTHCLTEKIKHCINNGVNPRNILAFTFTKEASQEFLNRLPDSEDMTIGTIHAVSLQILNKYSPKKYYVLNQAYMQKFVFDIFKEIKIDFDKFNKYLSIIDLAKNIFSDYYELLNIGDEKISNFFKNDYKLIDFAQKFELKKEKQHKITFSDMQLKAFNLLKDNPTILEKCQERWKYVFLDEAQDASNVDIELINILCKKYNNLFIVGDVKQKIYSFRTGDDSIGINGSMLMTNFKKYYPDSSIFSLPRTFRNSKNICQIGNLVASKIDGSVIDTISEFDGYIEVLDPFKTQREEAAYVSNLAISKFNEGKSVRILYRTNSQSLTFQQIILENNIPFSVNQEISIFNTKEVKTAMACCNLRFEYENMLLSDRIKLLKELKPLMSDKFALYSLTKKMEAINADCFINPEKFYSEKAFEELNDIKNKLFDLKTISDIFNYLSKICGDDDSFSDNAIDNLIGVAEFASNCITMNELNDLISNISKPRLLSKDERAISIGTIHSAKGQESDVVMITGAVDGMLPHQMSSNILEEINLWYVAITRAKHELYISSFLSFGKKEYGGTQFIDIIK